MLLVISSARRLIERYGEDGFYQIRQALMTFASSQQEDASVVFPDDADSMAQWSLTPISLKGSEAVRVALRRIAGSPEKPSAILIIGGDDVIPFCRLPNPVRNRTVDPDHEVLSDNPYGLGSSDDLSDQSPSLWKPEVPLGRLPDASPADLDGFVRQIEGLGQATSLERFGTFALVDQSFRQIPARVLPNKLTTLRISPGWHSGSEDWRTSKDRLFYFNLHGFDDRVTWRGFDPLRFRWVDAVRPQDITREAAQGAVVFAENCYGALVRGRSARQSIALAFLESGARGFVGATGTAFGSYFSPLTANLLSNADLLAKRFVEEMDQGAPLGKSLVEARRAFWAASEKNPRRLSFAQKTALQFVLFGNPLATV